MDKLVHFPVKLRAILVHFPVELRVILVHLRVELRVILVIFHPELRVRSKSSIFEGCFLWLQMLNQKTEKTTSLS